MGYYSYISGKIKLYQDDFNQDFYDYLHDLFPDSNWDAQRCLYYVNGEDTHIEDVVGEIFEHYNNLIACAELYVDGEFSDDNWKVVKKKGDLKHKVYYGTIIYGDEAPEYIAELFGLSFANITIDADKLKSIL